MFTNLEGKIQYNLGERIVPMNIRMINAITIHTQSQITLYEEDQVTFISTVARKQENYQQNNKGLILINDDTGQLELTIPLRSEIDQNLYLKINSDENKANYYNFILKARIYQNNILFDVQAIQQVEQTAMIIYHIIHIGTWRAQMKQKRQSHIQEQPQKILNNSLLIDESEQTQKKLTNVEVKDQILYQIKISGKKGKTFKELENDFYKLGLYNIQDIKKTIRNLTENKEIYQDFVSDAYFIQNQ